MFKVLVNTTMKFEKTKPTKVLRLTPEDIPVPSNLGALHHVQLLRPPYNTVPLRRTVRMLAGVYIWRCSDPGLTAVSLTGKTPAKNAQTSVVYPEPELQVRVLHR